MSIRIKHQTVGHTRTGKVIFCAIEPEEIANVTLYYKALDFSDDDLLDAFALFGYLAIRSIRKNEVEKNYGEHADAILVLISLQRFEEAKLRANVKTAFDLQKLGISRARQEFKDL